MFTNNNSYEPYTISTVSDSSSYININQTLTESYSDHWKYTKYDDKMVSFLKKALDQEERNEMKFVDQILNQKAGNSLFSNITNEEDILKWFVKICRNRNCYNKLLGDNLDSRFVLYNLEIVSDKSYLISTDIEKNIFDNIDFIKKGCISPYFLVNSEYSKCESKEEIRKVLIENIKSLFNDENGNPLDIESIDHTLNINGWISKEPKNICKISKILLKRSNYKQYCKNTQFINKEILKMIFGDNSDDLQEGIYSKENIEIIEDDIRSQYKGETNKITNILSLLNELISVNKKYKVSDIRKMFLKLLSKFDNQIVKSYTILHNNAVNNIEITDHDIQSLKEHSDKISYLIKIKEKDDFPERFIINDNPFNSNYIRIKVWGLTSDYNIPFHNEDIDGKKLFHLDDDCHLSHFIKFLENTPENIWNCFDRIIKLPNYNESQYDYSNDEFIRSNSIGQDIIYRCTHSSYYLNQEELKFIKEKLLFYDKPYRGIRFRILYDIDLNAENGDSYYGGSKWLIKKNLGRQSFNGLTKNSIYLQVTLLNSGYQEFKVGVQENNGENIKWYNIFNNIYDGKKITLLADRRNMINDNRHEYKQKCIGNKSIMSIEDIKYLIWYLKAIYKNIRLYKDEHYSCGDIRISNNHQLILLEPILKSFSKIIETEMDPIDFLPKIEIKDNNDYHRQLINKYALIARYNIIKHFEQQEDEDWLSK